MRSLAKLFFIDINLVIFEDMCLENNSYDVRKFGQDTNRVPEKSKIFRVMSVAHELDASERTSQTTNKIGRFYSRAERPRGPRKIEDFLGYNWGPRKIEDFLGYNRGPRK